MALDAPIGGNGTLFVGEDKIFELELLIPYANGDAPDASSVVKDMTGMTLLFDVRKKDTSNPPAIISITPTLVGTFNASRSINTQRARAVVTDTDMNLFKAGTYRHSWKRMDDGSETVLAWGDFAPEKATAP